MPHRLTATAESFIKANDSHSRQLADTEKRAVREGDVLEAATLRQAGSHMVVTEARLNGEALPEHLNHIHARHWRQDSPAEPPAAAPSAAPTVAPSGEDKRARALALLAEGRSVTAIARELRVGRASIKRWRDGG